MPGAVRTLHLKSQMNAGTDWMQRPDRFIPAVPDLAFGDQSVHAAWSNRTPTKRLTGKTEVLLLSPYYQRRC